MKLYLWTPKLESQVVFTRQEILSFSSPLCLPPFGKGKATLRPRAAWEQAGGPESAAVLACRPPSQENLTRRVRAEEGGGRDLGQSLLSLGCPIKDMA